jgi:hypothetical protein
MEATSQYTVEGWGGGLLRSRERAEGFLLQLQCKHDIICNRLRVLADFNLRIAPFGYARAGKSLACCEQSTLLPYESNMCDSAGASIRLPAS